MSDSNKYYWLKLRKDFFKREDMRIIRALPDGLEYVLLYIELLLLGMESEGELRVNRYVTHTPKTLALVTDTAEETVIAALRVFESFGLLEYLEDGTVRMKELTDMVGSETKWAKYKRNQKERQETDELENFQSQSKNFPTDIEIDIDTEKDIEIEKEKEKDIDKKREGENAPGGARTHSVEETEVKKKYGSYGWVELTDGEYAGLLSELGEAELVRCVTYIDESAQSTGNRNRWQDWELVLRRCSRENWGRREQEPPRQQPAPYARQPGGCDRYYTDDGGETDLERMKWYLEKLKGEE